jgi:hypothetical protein
MPRGRRRGKAPSALLKSTELLGWALGGLEREIAQTRERLASLTAEAARLRARVGGTTRGQRAEAAPAAGAAPGRRRRGKMTAAGRARISEMMKKRWAEAKKKNRNRL